MGFAHEKAATIKLVKTFLSFAIEHGLLIENVKSTFFFRKITFMVVFENKGASNINCLFKIRIGNLNVAERCGFAPLDVRAV